MAMQSTGEHDIAEYGAPTLFCSLPDSIGGEVNATPLRRKSGASPLSMCTHSAARPRVVRREEFMSADVFPCESPSSPSPLISISISISLLGRACLSAQQLAEVACRLVLGFGLDALRLRSVHRGPARGSQRPNRSQDDEALSARSGGCILS